MSPMTIGITLAVLIAIGAATWKAPRLTSILIWTSLATTLACTAGIMILPGDLINNLIWLPLLFPLIWIALQFWCYWDASKWRVTIGLIALCIVSGVAVSTMPPLG